MAHNTAKAPTTVGAFGVPVVLTAVAHLRATATCVSGRPLFGVEPQSERPDSLLSVSNRNPNVLALVQPKAAGQYGARCTSSLRFEAARTLSLRFGALGGRDGRGTCGSAPTPTHRHGEHATGATGATGADPPRSPGLHPLRPVP